MHVRRELVTIQACRIDPRAGWGQGFTMSFSGAGDAYSNNLRRKFITFHLHVAPFLDQGFTTQWPSACCRSVIVHTGGRSTRAQRQ